MGDTENFYYGSKFGFDPTYGIAENYGDSFLGLDYRPATGQLGVNTDPFTANQLAKVSDKISTGAKTIEVQGIALGGQRAEMGLMDKIPKQHWKEIERLKKLAGVDLTFHGPLFEPTGAKQGWKEEDRQNVERKMISAVRRSHALDPQGNLVVTFHASVGIPQPERITFNDAGEKEIMEFWVVDESGTRQAEGMQFRNVAPQFNYFKNQKLTPTEMIEKENKESWFEQLQRINFNVHQGSQVIENEIRRLGEGSTDEEKAKIEAEKEALLNQYKAFMKGDDQYIKEIDDVQKPEIMRRMNALAHGDIYLRQVYGEFQNIFNRAWKAAESNKMEENLERLKKFRDQLVPKLKDLEDDPSKVTELSKELIEGVNVLRQLTPPETIKPMRDWAIEQASTTFANVALDAYKKFEDHAPIISIENPPAGDGLSTADDIEAVVKKAREKFAQEAVDTLNLSKSEAEKHAEKLLGVTWDVGHINMIRGQGYEEKDVVEQTKQIAKYVKHVHLSDNFGIDHTELPMGMGNVPTKKMLDLIHQWNKKVKMIAETGDWYSAQGGLGQKSTPLRQTVNAFGSSVYGNGLGPYWNQVGAIVPGYFSGQGNINPDIHHSLYGSGFSNLPVELGGQMAGKSRVSGAPIE